MAIYFAPQIILTSFGHFDLQTGPCVLLTCPHSFFPPFFNSSLLSGNKRKTK